MGSEVMGHVVDEVAKLGMDVDDSADSGAGFNGVDECMGTPS